jgi:hypothetical protein
LLTGYEQNIQKNKLKPNNGEELRLLSLKQTFIQKNDYFNLKVALFVEKRKNKFAYEFKKNKFVFN